jgi:uncharacterized protein (TIGR03067 family)
MRSLPSFARDADSRYDLGLCNRLQLDDRAEGHGGKMGDESQPNHEVFISYSSKDKKWADATCAVLERHRIRCWIAPRDITPGTEWGAAIIHGMDASKIMVLIFSGHANESAQVRREVERAISKGLTVLPFRVENISPAGAMEYALSNTHWLDGFTKPIERQFDLLASSVEALLAKDRSGVAEQPLVSANPAARAIDRRLIAGGIAALVLLLGVGLFVMLRGGPSQEKSVANTASPSGKDSDTARRSDEERIEGRWQLIEHEHPKRKITEAELDEWKPVWTFRDDRLTTRRVIDGSEVVEYRGLYSLRQSRARNLFDFNGVQFSQGRENQQVEFHGIYEFEGEFLRVCYRVRRLPDAPVQERPDSFVSVHGRGGTVLMKFRRVTE